MGVSPAPAFELLESFIKHGSLKQKTISSKTIFQSKTNHSFKEIVSKTATQFEKLVKFWNFF